MIEKLVEVSETNILISSNGEKMRQFYLNKTPEEISTLIEAFVGIGYKDITDYNIVKIYDSNTRVGEL